MKFLGWLFDKGCLFILFLLALGAFASILDTVGLLPPAPEMENSE